MTKTTILWVGWMSRWGEPSPTHAYATGVYDCPEAARKAGDAESFYRGGKYEFQHSPSAVDSIDIYPLDFEEGEIPSKVIVASVSFGGEEGKGRCHFLGVFSSEEKAAEVARVMYPNWELTLEWFEVTRREEDVQGS